MRKSASMYCRRSLLDKTSSTVDAEGHREMALLLCPEALEVVARDRDTYHQEEAEIRFPRSAPLALVGMVQADGGYAFTFLEV